MLTEQIAREVARQLAPQAAESEAPPSSTPRPRPSTRDIPSEPSAASVVAPDDRGRAAGSLDARLAHEPEVTPTYEPPGPYPAAKRELGQPAPRGARWQPGGEDSGPQAAAPSWQPPLSEEPQRSEPEPQQATVSDSVWRAPAWLRPAEPAAKTRPAEPAATTRPATPAWTAPISGVATSQTEAKSAAPSWAPPAWSPPAPVAEPPAWSPEPARARTPRIPELGLEPEPASTKPDVVASYPKDDEEFVDGGFADEFEDEFDDRPAARVPAVEAPPKSTRKAAQPEPQEAPPPADPRPRAKPPKDADDDDFDDDDDDDDFDDDDDDDFGDDDEDLGSMAGEVMTSSIAAPVQPRKLPWIPIALAASVLVMISAYVFRDAIFGGGDEAAGDEEAEVAETQPEVQPELKPEPEVQPETKPEPPPPAIPEEELAAKLEEATKLLDRQKHADAAKIVDEILSKIPKEPRALALRAFSQLEKRKHDEALATANECLEVDPNQPTCWITIAVVEQEKNNLARSLEGYRKYLELEPTGRYAKVASGQVERLSKKVEG